MECKASDYLIKKWRKAFYALDINKDNILSIEDAYCYADNAIKGMKLKGQDALDFRSKFASTFQDFFLRGADKKNEEEMVELWKHEYNTNRISFNKHVRDVHVIYISFADTNQDGNISKEEYKALALAQGLESFDDRHFNAYPKNSDGTIPNDVLIASYCEYFCNNDESNVGQLERAVSYGFQLIDDI